MPNVKMVRDTRDVWPDGERIPGTYDVRRTTVAGYPSVNAVIEFICPRGRHCSVFVGASPEPRTDAERCHVWGWNDNEVCPTLTPSLNCVAESEGGRGGRCLHGSGCVPRAGQDVARVARRYRRHAAGAGMSLATWRDEFYPVEATKTTEADAAAHSLRKWTGLRPEALLRHGIVIGGSGVLVDGEGHEFLVDGLTCALCHHHFMARSSCRTCPLARVRGGVACDRRMTNEDTDPFRAFKHVRPRDPEPMIGWLQKAVDRGPDHA